MKKTLIKAIGLKKTFLVGEQEIEVLRGIDLEINSGDFVIIFGPSGCGKSTMLHSLLGLEPPSGGQILVEDEEFYKNDEDGRARYRKHHIGMIYQQPLWIRSLNVFDNVAMPLRLLGLEEDEVAKKVKQNLDMVGMNDWAKYMPMELSSGQQQKVSLARALTINPVVIAADEPTGNLDTISGETLMETFLDLNKQGRTIMMITHDLEYLKYATKIIHMVDGLIVKILQRKQSDALKAVNGKRGQNGQSAQEVTDVRDPNFLSNLKI